jgi:hypothetical protein
MRELSVAEQRYLAVLAVISDGRSITEVAGQWQVSRQTLHAWLARYEAGGLEALADLSHRPRSCPHQLGADRDGDQWVSRKVATNGIVCVDYQQVSVGKHFSGSACDVLATPNLLQFWIGNQLVKTVARSSDGEIRKKHAAGTRPRT